jgi:hypothetical protein
MHLGQFIYLGIPRLGHVQQQKQESNRSKTREMRESTSRNLEGSISTEKCLRYVKFGWGLEEGERKP